jgi:hypothetical protein
LGRAAEIGSVATPLEKPDPQQDLAKCQRFYNVYVFRSDAYGAAGQNQGLVIAYPTMRAAPTPAFSGLVYGNCSGITVTAVSTNSCVPYVTVTALGFYNFVASMTLTADL